MSNSHIFSWYFSAGDNVLCAGPRGHGTRSPEGRGWHELEPVAMHNLCITPAKDMVEAMPHDAEAVRLRWELPASVKIKLQIPYSP